MQILPSIKWWKISKGASKILIYHQCVAHSSQNRLMLSFFSIVSFLFRQALWANICRLEFIHPSSLAHHVAVITDLIHYYIEEIHLLWNDFYISLEKNFSSRRMEQTWLIFVIIESMFDIDKILKPFVQWIWLII